MLRSNTAGSLRPLTRALALGMVEFPLRGVASAFPASPMPEEVLPRRLLLLSMLLPDVCPAGCLHILAGL